MVLGQLDEPALRAVQEEVTARVAPFRRDGAIELPAVSLVACAR